MIGSAPGPTKAEAVAAAQHIFAASTPSWVSATGETWARVGSPIIERDAQGVAYAVNDGSTANFYTTPDSPANSVSGDITILWSGTLASVTPVSASVFVTKTGLLGQYGYHFSLNANGTLYFSVSITGSSVIASYSTVSIGSVEVTANTKVWLYVQRNASTGSVKFFYSIDGATYQQLGANIAGTAGSIFDSTAPVYIGISSAQTAPLTGKTYRTQVFAGLGITGTPVVDFNPGSYINTGGAGKQGGLYLLDQEAMYTAPDGAALAGTGAGTGLLLDASKAFAGMQGTMRRNLLTKTEDFANAIWTADAVDAVTVASTTVMSPTGRYFQLLSDVAAAVSSRKVQSSIVPADTTAYVGSVLTKYHSSAVVSLRMSTDTGGVEVSQLLKVNVQTGVLVSTTTADYGIVAEADGAYRIWVKVVNNGSNTKVILKLYVTNSGVVSDTGSVYATGAQIDAVALTSYQKIDVLWLSDIAGYHAMQNTAANRLTHLQAAQTGKRLMIPDGTKSLLATLPNLGPCTFVRFRPDAVMEVTEGVTVNGAVMITEPYRAFCGLAIISGTLTADQLFILRQLGGFYSPQLGAEIVVDGDFASTAGWPTIGANWDIANGIASRVITGSLEPIVNSAAVSVSQPYQIGLEMLTRIAGSVVLQVGGVNSPTMNAASTVYTYAAVATTTGPARVTPNNLFNGSADNVTVRPIV